MGGAPSSQSGGSQTQQTHNELPRWVGPFAKEYLASVADLIYGPGTTQPGNYIQQKGYNFGSGQPSQSGGPAAQGGASQAPQSPAGTQGLNPQLAQQFIQPMVGNSSYLQGQAQQNPNYLTNMSSPAAFNQLQSMYPALMGTS